MFEPLTVTHYMLDLLVQAHMAQAQVNLFFLSLPFFRLMRDLRSASIARNTFYIIFDSSDEQESIFAFVHFSGGALFAGSSFVVGPSSVGLSKVEIFLVGPSSL